MSDLANRAILAPLRAAAVKAANEGRLGRLVELPAAEVLPDRLYAARRAFLETAAAENDDAAFGRAARRSEYWRLQARRRGAEYASRKAARFRELYRSMRADYRADARHAPVVLVDPGAGPKRLDGTHRCAVLRFLGHETIRCAVIAVEEYQAFQEPFVGADAGNGGQYRAAAAEAIRGWEKWYQAIEVLPEIWTAKPRPMKTGPVVEAIGRANLAGRRAVDVGCNAGLYTLEAAAAGAAEAVGIDKRSESIDQAKFVRSVWSVTRPRTTVSSFKCGGVMDYMDLLRQADAVIACCVVYHLVGIWATVFRTIAAGRCRTLILQGNLGRKRKLDPALERRLTASPFDDQYPAAHIYDAERLGAAARMVGFEIKQTWPGQFPVVLAARPR